MEDSASRMENANTSQKSSQTLEVQDMEETHIASENKSSGRKRATNEETEYHVVTMSKSRTLVVKDEARQRQEQASGVEGAHRGREEAGTGGRCRERGQLCRGNRGSHWLNRKSH